MSLKTWVYNPDFSYYLNVILNVFKPEITAILHLLFIAYLLLDIFAI